MLPTPIPLSRVLLAGVAAGGWVVVSGMMMAGVFGYREMKAAFDVFGIPIRGGLEPALVHTTIRLLMGLTVAVLFVLLLGTLPPARAAQVAAGFVWLVGVVLPFAVVAEWGLFPWGLALKFWGWSAVELLIAGLIVRRLASG